MNALSTNTPMPRGLQDAIGYQQNVCQQDVCQKAQTETELTRQDIENAQAELGAVLNELGTTLAPVMREANEKLVQPSATPACMTAVHGWLCSQLYLLRSHIDMVRSITSRIEV